LRSLSVFLFLPHVRARGKAYDEETVPRLDFAPKQPLTKNPRQFETCRRVSLSSEGSRRKTAGEGTKRGDNKGEDEEEKRRDEEMKRRKRKVEKGTKETRKPGN